MKLLFLGLCHIPRSTFSNVVQGEYNNKLSDWDEIMLAKAHRYASDGPKENHGDCDENLIIIFDGKT